MKKIFLITIVLLTAYSLQLNAQVTYDSVANFTAKTSIASTDIFPFQTKVSNKFSWRKLTGLSLWNFITAVNDTNETSLLNASNSWNGINNFDGATFNAGSHGTVLFNGDSVVCTTQMFTHGIQRYSASSMIGRNTAPFFNVYANTFTVITSSGTDSAVITIDDDGILSMPHLKITESVSVDSGAGFRQVIYEPNSVTTISTNDTTLSLSSVQKYCLALIDLAGNTTSPGISYFNITGATIGYTIRIVNVDAVFSITLKNRVGNDDNLYITADLTLSQYDFIELMCIDETVNDQIWIETGRSNN